MSDTPPKRYATGAQVCARYGDCDRVTLWRWSKDPKTGFPAPALRINGRPLWDEGDLDRYDNAVRQNATLAKGRAAQ